MNEHKSNEHTLTFVFNAHLPYVKRQEDGLGVLEERWLFDALVWAYIPFIEMIKELAEKGFDFSVGVSLSPTLLAMMKDEFLMNEFEQYLDDSIVLGEKEHKRLKNSDEINKDACINMACHYRDHYIAMKHLYKCVYNRDIIAQWKLLAKLNKVEFCTTSGTYAFLPNFRNSKETVRAQIQNGLRAFTHIMESTPKGFFLPECGYYEGIEDELKLYGITYSFCDAQAIIYANSVPANGVFSPVYSKGKEVLFFPSDRIISHKVWSIQDGYMSQNTYRDFNKDIGDDVSLDYLSSTTHIKNVRMMTGYKYYAINDEGEEKVYDPVIAQAQVKKDVDSYVEKIMERFEATEKLAVESPVSTQIFDLDLLGQRWYEGVDWLKGVLEKIITTTSVKVSSPSVFLQGNESATYDEINLSFSSWSEKGYAQVWLDERNKQLNRDIYRCIELFKKLVQRAPYEQREKKDLLDRIIQQAGRELLLAQSSDWPFILHANKLTNYVNRELYAHIKNFNILYHMLISKNIDFTFVHFLEQQNNIFSRFDYSMFENKFINVQEYL